MVDFARLNFNLDGVEKAINNAVSKGLATKQIKSDVEKIAIAEIERAVDINQNLFRPDAGPGGGDNLVGELGIGQDGRPLKEKYAGKDAAWSLLKPGTASAKLSSSFRRVRAGKFGILNYEVDLTAFFNNFRSVYIGSRNEKIQWMQNLIDGVPIAQLVEFPPGVTGYAYVDGGPDFNPESSRTGFGHMVALERLKIPSQQFTFRGRGRANTFGKLLKDINKRFASNKFKQAIEKRIAKSINSGG